LVAFDDVGPDDGLATLSLAKYSVLHRGLYQVVLNDGAAVAVLVVIAGSYNDSVLKGVRDPVLADD